MIFILRKMTPIEFNYNIHNKKFLVIIYAFQQWRVYIKKFLKITVITDHKNFINFYIINNSINDRYNNQN